MNIKNVVNAALARLTPDTPAPADILAKVQHGQPLTEVEAALERVAHVAYVNGCPAGVGIVRWLFANGFVSSVGGTLTLTEHGVMELLIDAQRRGY